MPGVFVEGLPEPEGYREAQLLGSPIERMVSRHLKQGQGCPTCLEFALP